MKEGIDAPSLRESPTPGQDQPSMWCDDFDMDLPKVIPDARDLLGDMADVKLSTHGHTTYGALNHPSVWNCEDGPVAFFGFRSPRKPKSYWTNAPTVRCTFWQAVRDAWAHSYIMAVEGRPVLDTNGLYPRFERIMYDLRGWGAPKAAGVIARDKAAVRKSLVRAAELMRQLRAQTSPSNRNVGSTQKDTPSRPANTVQSGEG